MALTARDLKNDDTTDAGFDLVMDPLSSPAADVAVTKLMIGAAGDNDGLISSATPLPVSTEMPTAAALADDTGNPTVPGVGAFGMVFDGSTWDRMLGDATNGVLVNLGSNNDVSAAQSGTWNITNVSGTISLPTGAATAANQSTANSSLATLTDATELQGSDRVMRVKIWGYENDPTDDDAVNTSTTVRLIAGKSSGVAKAVTCTVAGSVQQLDAAARAKAINAEPSAASNGDSVQLLTDLVGKLITLPYSNPENFIHGAASATGTSNTAIMSAQGAGVRSYITELTICNTSENDTYVILKDGTTAVKYLPAPATSGATFRFPVPLRMTANTAVNFASGTSSTTMYVSASGYKGV